MALRYFCSMIVAQTLSYLQQGKIILYPTDTVWGIGGDATRVDVVERIYALKNRADAKALIGLVGSKEMLLQYINPIPTQVLPFLESDKPTTIIYNHPKGLAQNMLSGDQTVGLRLPKHSFLEELINAFGKAIISTSANMSGFPSPKSFGEIAPEILEAVDYIVPLEQEKISDKPSRIIKVSPEGAIEILRL